MIIGTRDSIKLAKKVESFLKGTKYCQFSSLCSTIWQLGWILFLNVPFPASFSFTFSIPLTANQCSIKIRQCLDSNRGPLLWEATALPTETHHCPHWFGSCCSILKWSRNVIDTLYPKPIDRSLMSFLIGPYRIQTMRHCMHFVWPTTLRIKILRKMELGCCKSHDLWTNNWNMYLPT